MCLNERSAQRWFVLFVGLLGLGIGKFNVESRKTPWSKHPEKYMEHVGILNDLVQRVLPVAIGQFCSAGMHAAKSWPPPPNHYVSFLPEVLQP